MVRTEAENLVRHKVTVLLVFFLGFQTYSWFESKQYIPALGIVPDVPTLTDAKISALGDEQFYFRYLALSIQNAGDSFGRYTKLQYYNYDALARWFKLLDELDARSDFIPSIAAYFYSNSQHAGDTRYIIDYLESTYDRDPPKKWWWLAQAVILCAERLKDNNLSLRLAFKLSNTPYDNLPRWAQQMPAIIYAQMGEKQLALKVMQDLLSKYDNYSQSELNYISYFIKQQLGYSNREVDKEPIFKDVEPLYKKKQPKFKAPE
jgi:hypothetical protein